MCKSCASLSPDCYLIQWHIATYKKWYLFTRKDSLLVVITKYLRMCFFAISLAFLIEILLYKITNYSYIVVAKSHLSMFLFQLSDFQFCFKYYFIDWLSIYTSHLPMLFTDKTSAKYKTNNNIIIDALKIPWTQLYNYSIPATIPGTFIILSWTLTLENPYVAKLQK